MVLLEKLASLAKTVRRVSRRREIEARQELQGSEDVKDPLVLEESKAKQETTVLQDS